MNQENFMSIIKKYGTDESAASVLVRLALAEGVICPKLQFRENSSRVVMSAARLICDNCRYQFCCNSGNNAPPIPPCRSRLWFYVRMSWCESKKGISAITEIKRMFGISYKTACTSAIASVRPCWK